MTHDHKDDDKKPEAPGPDAGDYDKPDDLGLDRVGDDKPTEEKNI